MTVLSKMMKSFDDSTLEDLLQSDNEEDEGFDELNYDGEETSDDDDEENSVIDFSNNDYVGSDEEDGDDDDEEDDDDEFMFDDVKQSIEYIQERYNFFKSTTTNVCNIYTIYLTDKDIITGVNDIDVIHKDNLNLVDGILTKNNLIDYLKTKRLLEGVDEPYYLHKIISHSFNLTPEQLIHLFDHEEEQHDFINNMMQQTNKLTDITFGKSLSLFDKYNSLFVFFTPEKPPRSKSRRSSKKKRPSSSQRNTLKKTN